MSNIEDWRAAIDHTLMALEAEQYSEAHAALQTLDREMVAASTTTRGAVAALRELLVTSAAMDADEVTEESHARYKAAQDAARTITGGQ